jgi:putative PIN family toxin of toxin-antitoxin system
MPTWRPPLLARERLALLVTWSASWHIVYDMKVALDTDVIVAALRSRTGASTALLRAVRRGQLEAVASVPMMLEYEAVLMRVAQRQAIGMTVQQVELFLDGLAALLHPVTPHFLWRPTLRDPNDEMVLDAAVDGWADVIVTFNIRDFLPGAAQFGIEVLTPAEVLRRL